MHRWVEISFDCLPLRTVGRLDIPIDASPKYRERCQAIKTAIEKHGSHNTYYLYNASCTFHLTNDRNVGSLEFKFDGTVITDADDISLEDVADVTRFNEGRTVIHAVELSERRSAQPNSPLRRLAGSNGGTYRQVVPQE